MPIWCPHSALCSTVDLAMDRESVTTQLIFTSASFNFYFVSWLWPRYVHVLDRRFYSSSLSNSQNGPVKITLSHIVAHILWNDSAALQKNEQYQGYSKALSNVIIFFIDLKLCLATTTHNVQMGTYSVYPSNAGLMLAQRRRRGTTLNQHWFNVYIGLCQYGKFNVHVPLFVFFYKETVSGYRRG